MYSFSHTTEPVSSFLNENCDEESSNTVNSSNSPERQSRSDTTEACPHKPKQFSDAFFFLEILEASVAYRAAFFRMINLM